MHTVFTQSMHKSKSMNKAICVSWTGYPAIASQNVIKVSIGAILDCHSYDQSPLVMQGTISTYEKQTLKPRHENSSI